MKTLILLLIPIFAIAQQPDKWQAGWQLGVTMAPQEGKAAYKPATFMVSAPVSYIFHNIIAEAEPTYYGGFVMPVSVGYVLNIRDKVHISPQVGYAWGAYAKVRLQINCISLQAAYTNKTYLFSVGLRAGVVK